MLGISPQLEMGPRGDTGDAGPIGPRLFYFGASSNTFTTTRVYYQPYSTDFNVTTTIMEVSSNITGVLRNLFFFPGASNAADSAYTITVFVNGVATALTVTLPAGSTSIVSDIVHTVNVVPGDTIALSSTRPAGTFGIGLGKCYGIFERTAT